MCDKSFAESGGLKKHVNSVHNGLKNHECVFCEKLYARSHEMKKHVQSWADVIFAENFNPKPSTYLASTITWKLEIRNLNWQSSNFVDK